MKQNLYENKIVKSFYVVGINELKLQKYNITNNNEESSLRFIQKIDILCGNLNIKNNRFDRQNETWLKVINSTNYWIRLQYTDSYTDPITDLRICETNYYSEEYLLLPRNLYNNGYRPVKITKCENNINDIKDFPNVAQEERSFQLLDDKYLLIPSEYNSKTSLNLPSRKKAAFLLINRKTCFLPLLNIILQKNNNSYNFGLIRHKSPYSFKYLPEVLDIYPNNEEQNKAVAMFCFPEGVKIKNRFETPKCFNFVLTDEVGDRTYGSTLIFVEEISISLREAFIPSYNEPNKKFYCEKSICVLSKYPFYYNCLLFLKEIYQIVEPKSSGKIPIERAICTFVDSLYLQSYDKILRFNINDRDIDFYKVANYGQFWDTNDKYIETLFRLLSYEQIITAWQGLLLEKKLYLICSSKIVLSQVAHALINLLFPFKWIHVYVPILPEKLRLFIESPVPLIIGISFHIEINELPSDSLILDINKNKFENYKEKIPPLPSKLNKILMTRLNKLKEQYQLDNPLYVEKIITNLEEAVIYLGPEMSFFPKIDICEIRDAFYNVFIAMFKNYEKYFSWMKQSVNLIGTEMVFLKENFLKEFSSLESDSFLFLFSETALFSQFIDSFGIEEKKISSSFAFFLESIKNPKGKKNFLQNIIPKNVVFAPKIDISDLNNRTFNYPEFPRFNSSLFIKHEAPKIPKKSKFSYLSDEWCFSTEKFKIKDWPRYFLYLIYDIWFTFFSFVLNIYEDNQAIIMMDYGISLIEYLTDKLKITPTRNLFSKIIKSCGRACLNPFVKQILIMIKNINKGKPKYNSLFHNDYLNGIYFLTQNVGHNSLAASLTNSRLLTNTFKSTVIKEMKQSNYNINSNLKTIIFMSYNLCQNCLMTKCITKKIPFDEILSGFIMRKNNDNTSICSQCLNRFEPKIFYLENNQEDLNLKEITLYSPMELIKKIDEIIKEKGEIYFYQENNWSDIYWNIIFYFELFDLPTCVLYVENDIEKFEKINKKLRENKKRKFNKSAKVPKKNNFFIGRMNKTSTDVNLDSAAESTKAASNLSNNISDISFNSVKSASTFNSNTEMDIWKNYQLQKQYPKKELKENNNNFISKGNDDKNEVNNRLKETKFFYSDIIDYFNSNFQEKLMKFLDYYDKLENIKQHDYVNMHLRKEIEKIDKKQKIQQNQKNQKPKEEKNLENMQNSNIQQNNQKKDDTFSINTRYNFNINPITSKFNNNIMEPEIKNTINKQEQLPLDNNNNNLISMMKNDINNRINTNKNEQEKNIKNDNINLAQKININNNDDIKNMNTIKDIISAKELKYKTVYPKKIKLNPSKGNNKIVKINDNNIKNISNIEQRKKINNTLTYNNEIDPSNYNIDHSKKIFLNQNYHSNKNFINIQNYDDKAINNINQNNSINKRYAYQNTDNIGISNDYINNIKEPKDEAINIPFNSNYVKKANIHKIQGNQAELYKKKYQIHNVPAYNSIFDENNNL